jgi:hypothetical protein
VQGNRFAALTLQAMGFADAAEVFVFIAGLAAVYAYRRKFAESGWLAGASAVAARIRTLYFAHLVMIGAVLGLVGVILLSGSGYDIIQKLGLAALLDAPGQALPLIPVLGFLPHYMDILPLYVVLLASLPLIIAGFRLHPLLPLAVAAIVHVCAGILQFNLPSFGSAEGWFLNPFAWALVFTAGATTAELACRGAFARLPRTACAAISMAAAAYVIFAFLIAAPWRVFPALEPFAALTVELAPNKMYMSWHRLCDIAAKAWLVAVLIPPTAAFMTRGLGGVISRAGRQSLPLFIGGTLLSIIGSVIVFETEGHAVAQIAVTFGGVTLLLWAAHILEARTMSLKPAANAGRVTSVKAPA